MDSPNLLTRIVAPLLPLIVIALIAGAAGYALTEPSTRPIPVLEPAEDTPRGAVGELQSLSDDEVTLTTDGGTSLTLPLASNVQFEVLEPITFDQVAIGDWLNGGAIPHAQTILALVNLILIEEPVEP